MERGVEKENICALFFFASHFCLFIDLFSQLFVVLLLDLEFRASHILGRHAVIEIQSLIISLCHILLLISRVG